MTEAAPKTISLKWCPVCGRDDRFASFTGKSHFSRGERCNGQPIELTYSLTMIATTEEP